jgi:hypothetical protein
MLRLPALALLAASLSLLVLAETAESQDKKKPDLAAFAGKWKATRDTLTLDENGVGRINIALVDGKDILLVVNEVKLQVENNNVVFNLTVGQDSMKWLVTLSKDKKTLTAEQIKGKTKRPKVTFKPDDGK